MPGKTMKAVQVAAFGGPEVLKLVTDVSVPEPKKGEVLVQVKAVGVNPTDTYTRAGMYQQPNLPYIPGADAAGVVAAVGEGVSNFKIGDRVYTCLYGFKFNDGKEFGSYAEYSVAPAARVFRLPDELSFSQGAALGIPYFTAVRALKYKANAQSGERILIHGASGGVGLAAVQICKSWGLDVVGTASTDIGTELVKASGARLVLNHRDKNHKQNLLDATEGKKFDVILEMIAGINLRLDTEIIAPHGRIVVIGSRGDATINPDLLMIGEVNILGLLIGRSTDAEFAEMAKILEQGVRTKFVNPVIDQELPLDQAPKAHEAVIDHVGGSKGKIILIP
ncbi:Quinone oxidoreductase [Hypsibius exemplaris]|uniref:Quinone oxidoreductase n=1 Tax=Hypsibius exemplaris TaxID=2072580 RepID=A0A1W0X7Q7_HYPEX|nr:Quinone oxidoreductase [Hypsibius exemplaris]